MSIQSKLEEFKKLPQSSREMNISWEYPVIRFIRFDIALNFLEQALQQHGESEYKRGRERGNYCAECGDGMNDICLQCDMEEMEKEEDNKS